MYSSQRYWQSLCVPIQVPYLKQELGIYEKYILLSYDNNIAFVEINQYRNLLLPVRT
jgi:hypothetical protein